METIFLEQWLHDVIRGQARVDSEYKHIPDNEKLTRQDVDTYHLSKLKKVLAYVYEKSSFYRELFLKNEIKPDDIRSLEDLEKLPFTDPSDLATNSNRFICGSIGDIARITTFTTSGTTGNQKRIFRTEVDLDRITDFMGVGMRTVTTPDDVVQIILPFGSTNNQGDLLSKGLRKIGATPVGTHVVLNPEKHFSIMQEHKPTILFGPPYKIYRITQELCDKYDLSKMGVKTIFLTSSYLSEPMKARIQNIWNCDIHCHYGLTEMGLAVAINCHAHHGYHFNEVDLLLEIIDPHTGKRTTGEGELVFTTLNMNGMPLIRYRTHDISKLIPDICPCGASTLLRFDTVYKRLESIVKIGDDDEIYTSMFDDILFTLPEIIDYHVILNRKDSKDSFSFIVESTRSDNDIEQRINKLLCDYPVIERNVVQGRLNKPTIDLVPVGKLSRVGRAKKMIVDKRMLERSRAN